jgi:hypothetical protein
VKCSRLSCNQLELDENSGLQSALRVHVEWPVFQVNSDLLSSRSAEFTICATWSVSLSHLLEGSSSSTMLMKQFSNGTKSGILTLFEIHSPSLQAAGVSHLPHSSEYVQWLEYIVISAIVNTHEVGNNTHRHVQFASPSPQDTMAST